MDVLWVYSVKALGMTDQRPHKSLCRMFPVIQVLLYLQAGTSFIDDYVSVEVAATTGRHRAIW